MYPVNRFMDSHPCQRNQVPYSPHYYPHFEPNPHHQMNIDPTRSPLPYESWPCGGSYGHPYPPQCHSCCIHNNSPSQCAFRPPYAYPPTPIYSNCSYPTYPVTYPTHYVPPPHFNMEQPRFEYEKKDHHCCACPNHQCSSKKGGSNVKIEEHDYDKKNESNESLVPMGFKNSPYPVVCLPPDDMKNRERVKPNGSTCEKEEDNPQVVKPFSNFRPFQQPNVWNVLPSHNGNNSESPKQRVDLPGKQHHDDVFRKQFPFPIIWMPYKPEENKEEVSKETESNVIAEKEPTSLSKLTKPMLHDSEDKKSTAKENEVKGGSEIHGKGLNKGSVVKTIPVKQVEQNEILDGKKEGASQRHDSDAKQKKINQEGAKKQSPSPTKSSKLPPVCLRVDPLPMKKSSNGNSRSPSPPGGKGNLVESRSDSSKHPILSNEKEHVQLDKSTTTSMPEKNIEVEPSKSKTKVVEVAQGKSGEDKLQDQCTVLPDLKCQAKSKTDEGDPSKAANELEDQPDRVAAKAKSSNEGHQKCEAREAVNGDVDAGDEIKREKRSQLSNDKAATMIQSAYRGFNVRKWEPLKKLKQIAKIEGQMAEIKKCVHDLESSADNGVDNKQKTIITEVIMGLLLKLDTIQGLHPTIREYRKSVAKELVSLQEKLDLLNCKKQQAESEQTLLAKSSDDICLTMQNLERNDDLARGDEGIKFDAKGLSEEQPQMLSNSHDVGNAVLAVKEENKDGEEVMEDVSGGSAVKTGDGASVKPLKSEEKADKLLDENAAVVEKLEEHGEGVDELEELPRGVLDEETSVEGSADIREDVVLQNDKGNLTAPIPEEKGSDAVSLEHHQLEALGETPVILGPENAHSSNGQEENAEILGRDTAVTIDIPEPEKEDTRPLSEDIIISDLADKVGVEKNEKELEQTGSASDDFSIQSQEDAITTKQPTDTTNTEESETAGVLQEKMQNAIDRDIEILDSGKTIEQSAQPRSTVANDEAQEYNIQDEQKVGDENKEVQGEELARNDAVISEPDIEGKEHNVEVEQRHVKENFEMQGKEPVPNDNAAPVSDKPVDSTNAMVAPTSEAATTKTELSGEKEFGEAEDHSTYPSTCDAIEGNSADAYHSFGSTPAIVPAMVANDLKEWKKVDMSPSSPTASQVSCDSDALSESDRKLIEENEKLREIMEKLIKSGNEQLSAISSLSGRVKDLEKRLSRKKKLKLKRNRLPAAGSTCVKPLNDSLRDRAVGLAM